MKSIKNKLMIAVVALFIAGSSVVSSQVYGTELPCGDSGCGYNKKECLFRKDTKCSGSGNECAIADPCNNEY